VNLTRRSIISVNWNVFSGLFAIAVMFVRSVLLARWLPVDTFGVYAGAHAIVGLTSAFAAFGMGGAFLHRSAETTDEDQAAALHFTLKLLFTLAWALIMIGGALIFSQGDTRTALVVITTCSAVTHLCQTPRLILTRRVVHRRLALLDMATTLASEFTAIFLALRGATLWALLATNIANAVVTVLILYIWRPFWRPRLAWSAPGVRYYLNFGSRNFAAVTLQRALDRVDDVWTSLFLGKTAMGYYSRAYNFATYPSLFVAQPIEKVVGGTYAELKGDGRRLSKAFFRTNAFLVRTGFILAGLLSLTAPELIVIVLGAKWLPMLDAFRLMLVFTLFDPIKLTIGSLFVAVGRPEVVVRARLIQLGLLLVGLFVLGPVWGIAGVALAVDIMLVAGIGILLWQARPYVRFSVRRLFAVPMLGLVAGLVVAWLLVGIPSMPESPWVTGAVKTAAFLLVYGLILLALERRELRETAWPMFRQVYQRRQRGSAKKPAPSQPPLASPQPED
jgi:O-antigen/teichoic acid export membrane protein